MTFDEAINLAADIHASDKATLISVGRFLRVDDLVASSPWGCSVLVAGQTQSKVVWSLAEYCDLFKLPKSEISDLQSQIAKLQSPIEPPRPDAVHRRQPTLF